MSIRAVFCAWVLLGMCAPMAVSAKAYVSGRMKNAAAGEAISLFVPHFYIDNRSDDFKTTLGSQQEFGFELELWEPQLVFLVFGEDQLPVFLEPNDTLVIKADMFQFPVSVVFGGRGGGNNRLLKEYLGMALTDFNEFNNVRFKVGQWWFPLESPVNEMMLNLSPDQFKGWAQHQKQSAWDLYDRFREGQPDALTPAFREWIEAEIIYEWAYHLLMYGQVYKNRYSIEDGFFEFLFEAPTVCAAIGSESYRQFLLVLMARTQARKQDPERFFAGQYDAAAQLLEGRSLSWFQSEIIRMAFSADRLQEILPAYLDFVRNNKNPAFEPKVTAMYERTARLAPGAAIPDFSGNDYFTGMPVSPETLKGHVTYLNFWASWCGACLKKMEVVTAFSSELNAAGVKVVNISIDDNREAWEEYLRGTNSAEGYHLWAKMYPEQQIPINFGVQAVPQYYILGANGRIAEKPYSQQPNDIIQRLLELARRK